MSLDKREVLFTEVGSPKFQDWLPPPLEASVNVTAVPGLTTVEGEIVIAATGVGDTVIMLVTVVLPVQLFASVQEMEIE